MTAGPIMSNVLECYPDGSFEASGDLPAEENEGSSQPMTPALRTFISAMHAVRQLYEQLIAGDGRLIGQERFALSECLDRALNRLVRLRLLLEEKDEFTALNMKYNYRFHVRAAGRKWSGRGLLGIYQKTNFTSLDMWLSRVMTERLTEIVRFYGQALADGVIDSRERIVLGRAMDGIVFGIILVKINIQTGDVA